jgi:hypothetical protein
MSGSISVCARYSASALYQDNVAPSSGQVAVSHLAQLLTSADFPESVSSDQPEAGFVLGEDAPLQRPYSRLFGGFYQGGQKGRPYAFASMLGAYIETEFRHP